LEATLIFVIHSSGRLPPYRDTFSKRGQKERTPETGKPLRRNPTGEVIRAQNNMSLPGRKQCPGTLDSPSQKTIFNQLIFNDFFARIFRQKARAYRATESFFGTIFGGEPITLLTQPIFSRQTGRRWEEDDMPDM